jgi:putative flippase GtrA
MPSTQRSQRGTTMPWSNRSPSERSYVAPARAHEPNQPSAETAPHGWGYMMPQSPPAYLARVLRAVFAVRLLRYAAVGACAAVLQVCLLTLFIEVVGVSALLASTVALSISIIVNYSLQHRVTFRSKSRHFVAAPRFVALTLCTLAANALVFNSLLSVLPYVAAQVLTLGAIFPINYYLNRTLTFRL